MPSCRSPSRGDDVDEVVERALPGGGIRIEQTALVARRIREADRRGEPLAERTGRDLHAVGVAELRVTGGLRAPRAQRLEVVELEAEPAEIQLHVLRERRVAGREDEPVATGPVHIARVVVHDALVQQVRRRSKAHRRAGVAVAHLLDRVRRQHASGVHRAPIDFIPTQFRHRAAFLRGSAPESADRVANREEQPAQGARVVSAYRSGIPRRPCDTSYDGSVAGPSGRFVSGCRVAGVSVCSHRDAPAVRPRTPEVARRGCHRLETAVSGGRAGSDGHHDDGGSRGTRAYDRIRSVARSAPTSR